MLVDFQCRWGNIFCSWFNFFAWFLFNCFACVNCFAQNLFNFIARIWFNCFARNYMLIFPIFAERDLTVLLTIFLTISISLIFFFYGVILSLSTLMFTILCKCAVLCYGYAAHLSDSLWQLSIQVCKSLFVAHNYFVPEFNDSNISFIWLIFVSFAAHACLKVEVQNCLPRL